MGHYWPLRATTSDHRPLWTTVGNHGPLQATMGHYGPLWATMALHYCTWLPNGSFQPSIYVYVNLAEYSHN